MRLLAHVADLGTLQEAFRNGVDIHRQTASQVCLPLYIHFYFYTYIKIYIDMYKQ